MRIELTLAGSEALVSAGMGREIYRVVREALVNAARHSQGSVARAQVELKSDQVWISVCDNGVGFPFRGYYDQATLTALGVGPTMLKSRIASLEGSLSIHSGESGARLEIMLPLAKSRT
jgi:signal transduction histidine kinase